MQYWPASTLLQIPEDKRQIVYDSGVYMVNDCFLPLYKKKSFRKHLFGSRGSGKSHHVTDYADYILETKKYARVLFLRYVSEDVRDSLWRDFTDRLAEKGRLGDYDLVDTKMRAKNRKTGNELVSKGVMSQKSRTAKMKSLAGFTHIIIDEADEIPQLEKQKLIDSVRKKGVEIEITEIWNTARKSHHIYDDYILTPVPGFDGYFTAVPKPESGILSIHTTYKDNLHNLNEEFIRRYDNAVNHKDQNYYLTDVRGFIPSGNKGAIYKGWKRISRAEYDSLEYNKYYVNDWGTNDPNALVEIKVYQNTIMARGLLYRPIELQDLAVFLCQKGFTEKELILCDSAQPLAIIALQGFNEQTIDASLLFKYPQLRKGFNTVGVPKPPGSILDGIRMLQGYDVYIVEDEESEHIWNEYTDYMWELDKDGKPTDQPVDKKNHYMDDLRYFAYVRNNL